MGVELHISRVDVGVIVSYLLIIVAVGLYAGVRQRQSGRGDYFLAGRTLSWSAIGLALFSTNISTLELVSLMEEGYKRGLVYGNTEIMAPLTLIALALCFVPFYIRSGISTLPTFLEKRYGKTCRYLLVVFALGYAIFGHLGFALFTGGKVVEAMFGLPLIYSMTLILIATGLYTAIGGLKSVVWTEAIQAVVLLVGMLSLAAIGYHQVGGWSEFTAAIADEPVRLQLLRADAEAGDMTWYGVLLGYPVIGIWFWCTDQTIVQRALGAIDENHAQVGALFAGFIKVAGLFLFMFPGMFCYVLVKRGTLGPLDDPAHALPFMITNLLPTGMVGLMAAAMLSALMSTVAGALNSTATVCCYDIYKEIRPNASDRSLIHVGRLVTVAAIVASILWAPYINNFGSILEGNTMLIAYMAPSVTAVFLWGVFSRRASNRGAIACLAVGVVVGSLLFALDWNGIWKLSFMLTCAGLFAVCSIVLFGVSALFPQKLTVEQESLVWKDLRAVIRQPGWRGIGNYKLLSVILFLTVVVIYAVF